MFTRYSKLYKTNHLRRHFLTQGLKHAFSIGAFTCLGLSTNSAIAAWPKKAFQATSYDEALKKFLDSKSVTYSSDITIQMPEAVLDNNMLPIEINSAIPQTQSLSIFSSSKQAPLIAHYQFSENTIAYIATRIRITASTDIIAIAETAEGLYSNSQKITAAISGYPINE